MYYFKLSFLFFYLITLLNPIFGQEIPLQEHPRPDFERKQWQNLNGEWAFAFDSLNIGQIDNWERRGEEFNKTILVPFPWGSKLSGLEDEADIGWYHKSIQINPTWKGQRIFLTIGAADWETSVWLDGVLLGKHQGGYVPFSFELTDYVQYGKAQQLVIRVDDARRDFTLYGKQGYGNARGIWQTVYLEARGVEYLDALHFSPDIDKNKVKVKAYLPTNASEDIDLTIRITTPSDPIIHQTIIPKGVDKITFEIPIPNPTLWSLKTPYLYEVKATLGRDELHTYFGMRKISVMNLPGTEHPYIALNNEPIYVQLTLDQSYHPDGFYTFPSDQFMKEEILRSKSIGLNGIRTHIKVEVPRKLYWADKLGLLVMEDLPNSWGEPDAKMQAESSYTLKEMIKRDYNHPAIFSWVVFNETWGLMTTTGKDEKGKKIRAYLPETQDWVASMYYLAKSLDQTRLVEDNSICCGRGHTETDINSWHVYLPGWEWGNYLTELTKNTYEGSTHHFEEGFKQGRQPNINSECGNVWGYEGSAGDIDWSWDYHRMMNSFRQFPQVGGWLYTEHHDVINEWNGYWRFDRSEKETGVGDILEGMSLNDLHAAVYLSTGNDICQTVKGGEKVKIPLFLSVMTGEDFGKNLTLRYELSTTNYIGETEKNVNDSFEIAYQAWMQKELSPLEIQLPDISGVSTLKFWIKDQQGRILQRNFMHFEILSEQTLANTAVYSVAPNKFSKSEWSLKQWEVMEGKKMNGAGSGYFEYTISIPKETKLKRNQKAWLLAEMSAKELFVKDQQDFDRQQDYMKGSKVAPSANPNSYPMTDEKVFPSKVAISINGQKVKTITLSDDPADHRGVLSWHHQLKDKKLREAGSYGYLIKVPLTAGQLKKGIKNGALTIRFQTEGTGGIAIYGKAFGRYMLDPSLVIR